MWLRIKLPFLLGMYYKESENKMPLDLLNAIYEVVAIYTKLNH
jgi:hypothetical protein